MNGYRFSRNAAKEHGGTLFAVQSTVNITDNDYSIHLSRRAGCLWLLDVAINCANSKFESNQVDYGGVLCANQTSFFRGCSCNNNCVPFSGGMAYLRVNSTLEMETCVATNGNESVGDVVYASENPEVTGIRFAFEQNNTVTGGCLRVTSSSAVLMNCSFSSNNASDVACCIH